MRVGIDAHILGKRKGGVERVVKQMVTLLPKRMPDCHFVVFLSKHYRHDIPFADNVECVLIKVADPFLQRSWSLPIQTYLKRLDFLIVQRIAPAFSRCPSIVHIHDILPITSPEDHRGLRDRVVRWLTQLSAKHAKQVLTVSQSVADEIVERFPFTRGKVVAVHNGIEHALFESASSSKGADHLLTHLNIHDHPRYLYVGAIMSRKNLEVALNGFAIHLDRWKANLCSEPHPVLLIAGICRSEAYEASLKALAQSIAPGSVHFLGYISDDTYSALMQSCSLFLAPSRGEGFDLPALEAMSCRRPVIASDIPVHRELLEGKAYFFETNNPDSMAEALDHGTSDAERNQELTNEAYTHAQKYTWEHAANQWAEMLYGNINN